MPDPDHSPTLTDLPFFKMTGSGNDFVFFDGRTVDAGLVTRPEVVQAICNRYNGIGADGLVVLQPWMGDDAVRILYFNSDGSAADLCGNATLCSTTLSSVVGLVSGDSVRLDTPSGEITGRIRDGLAEIDLGQASVSPLSEAIELVANESRVGFVKAGIPHLVLWTEHLDQVDVADRGPVLRRHVATGAAGSNVNWVAPRGDGTFEYRTFERGVEGETLACGTGAVATAVQLVEWGLAVSPVVIRSSSGRDLIVSLRPNSDGTWRPTLRGEGRIVFRGTIQDLPF